MAAFKSRHGKPEPQLHERGHPGKRLAKCQSKPGGIIVAGWLRPSREYAARRWEHQALMLASRMLGYIFQ